eukprot:1141032-Pelagomonas_calceolata.AAC.6
MDEHQEGCRITPIKALLISPACAIAYSKALTTHSVCWIEMPSMLASTFQSACAMLHSANANTCTLDVRSHSHPTSMRVLKATAYELKPNVCTNLQVRLALMLMAPDHQVQEPRKLGLLYVIPGLRAKL